MPLYEYHCEACQSRFERIQKFSDPPVETCPSCGGAVRKLLSSPAIQFKGSGWYITDYARKGGDSKKPAEGGKDSAAGDSAGKDTGANADSSSGDSSATSAKSPAPAAKS